MRLTSGAVPTEFAAAGNATTRVRDERFPFGPRLDEEHAERRACTRDLADDVADDLHRGARARIDERERDARANWQPFREVARVEANANFGHIARVADRRFATEQRTNRHTKRNAVARGTTGHLRQAYRSLAAWSPRHARQRQAGAH